jgi:DNA-binding SARP family transcriptional activator
MAADPMNVSVVDQPPGRPDAPASDAPAAVRLLGPLEVQLDGRPIVLARRKQRSLLALLALRAGEVVRTDRIVECLWGECPPKAAIGSLRNLISELRKALGSETVRTLAEGYLLEVERDCVDVHRFESLVTAAYRRESAGERAEELRAALALWRGPPLAEFAFAPFARAEIARLEELNVAAREELVEAELSIGLHCNLVSDLQGLITEHPLRERLRAQLMLALYRSGRQTEALAAYRDARTTLQDLGLEPGDELRRLQRAILVHDASLEPAGSVDLQRGDTMDFRVLGPLEVAANGHLLRLGRTQQRALLAFLLIHANRVVSREQLISALWEDRLPETAPTALHGYVSSLRKLIGATRIETRSPGYILHTAAGEVDLDRFEHLFTEARALEPRQAAERLREALTLWRGPPLADLDAFSFVRVEQLRLLELRMNAVEERIDADLTLGRHSELIAELQALVREHPSRERLRGQLMLALYRSGRQADALEVYRLGRHLLVEELGLEPGEDLRRLEQAILQQQPALHDPNPQAALRGNSDSRTLRSAEERDAGGRRSRNRRLAAAVAALLLTATTAGIVFAVSRGSADSVTVVPNSVAIVDAKTNRLVGDVLVGKRPVAITFGEGDVWVANADDRTVSRIDPATRREVRVMRVGTDLRDITTGFGFVWTADGGDGTVTRIDPKGGNLTTVRLPAREPGWPVTFIAAGAGSIWATRANTLVEIDPSKGDVVATMPIPAPTGLAAGLGAAWVVTENQRLLQVVPGGKRKPIVKVEIGYEAHSPTVGAGSVWLIAYHGTGEIWRIDPRSGLVSPTPRVGRYPLDLAVPSRTDDVWAVDITGAALRVNPNIGLTIRKIRAAPTIKAKLVYGDNAVWIAVPD